MSMMPGDADKLMDRRRLKRRITIWRVVAIVALVAVVIAAVGRLEGIAGGDHVARLWVAGLIVDDPDRDQALTRLTEDARVKALIVRIDSPGGTVVGGEALYRALRRVAQAKPVVAVMSTEAASAGYMAALGADYIIARESTITGSIGVIFQTAEITRLLKKIGVSTEAIKSGSLKAAPSPFEPMTDEAREAARAVVSDIFELFVDLVAERRGLTRERAHELADGRVYTGRQALGLELIDGLGGETEARAWLASAREVAESLPVRDLQLRPLDGLFGELAAMVRKALFSERLVLDGLVSVWHPGVGP